MGRELNLESIQAMEKQVEEHKKAIIKLNRARNSLLNVSTIIPPEILGTIFYWVVMLGRESDRSHRTAYNFLLVCHHWFEVASRTTELWISWGDNLEDWERRHTCLRAARLDLELYEGYGAGQPLNESLRDALQDRATRGSIRRVCLSCEDYELLNSVISSITVNGEGVRSNGAESFKLVTAPDSESTVELSNFFARYNFPKLRYLQLSGRCVVSSWDSLASRTAALTTLSLGIGNGCPTPTTNQLLSILSSNPYLQRLDLSRGALPSSNGDGSPSQVQLRHLKKIGFSGHSRDALGLLNRLVPSNKMDRLRLTLSACSTLDLSRVLGPYLGDHLRRRGKLQQGPAVGGGCTEELFFLRAGDVKQFNSSHTSDGGVDWFMDICGAMAGDGGPQGDGKLFLDSLRHIPHGHVVCYESPSELLKSPELSAGMSNLIELRLVRVRLSGWFVEPDPGGTRAYWELPPSLKYLLLVAPTLDGGDWSPLTNFLSRRASVGHRLDSLTINERPHICRDVVDDIGSMVGNFEISQGLAFEDMACPRSECWGV